MLSAESDSSVRKRRIFFPGQTVNVVAGPLEGLRGTVIEHEEEGTVVLRAEQGVYVRIDENKLRRVRRKW